MTQRIPALIVLFSLAACSPNLAQEPAAAFAARVDSAIAAADTAQLASLAESRCASLDNEARTTCYEDYFLALADSGRVSLALGALEHLGRLRPEVDRKSPHSLTHVACLKRLYFELEQGRRRQG